MTTNVLTVQTKLYKDVNTELYDYFDKVVPFYSFLFRQTFHHFKNGLDMTESHYRTWLMKRYNITNRLAKVLVKQAKNHLKLLKASHDYQISNAQQSYYNTSIRIEKLRKKLNTLKTGLYKHNTKKKLFKLQVRLNKLKQRLEYKAFKCTFGTNHFLKTNMAKFKFKRDNQLVYIGDKYETSGNQQFQLRFDTKRNKFYYKARYENNYIKNDIKYYSGEFIITDKHAKQMILNTLKNPKSNPLTFRIIRRDTDSHLQIMYHNIVNNSTRNTKGVIGIDFNKGFINLSEIDQFGNLMKTHKVNYIHKGVSTKTSASMAELVKRCRYLALTSGKDIVIEDLKSLNKRKHGDDSKRFNGMIHLLKFGQFKKRLFNSASKYGYTVHLVNPAYTSRIANQKYTKLLKLNIHTAASYVIARRYYKFD